MKWGDWKEQTKSEGLNIERTLSEHFRGGVFDSGGGMFDFEGITAAWGVFFGPLWPFFFCVGGGGRMWAEMA